MASALRLAGNRAGGQTPRTPVYSYFVLDNGLQVLLQEKHDLPLTGITLAVNLGIKDEAEDSSGYTHLLEHMLLFGSSAEAVGRRPPGRISQPRHCRQRPYGP